MVCAEECQRTLDPAGHEDFPAGVLQEYIWHDDALQISHLCLECCCIGCFPLVIGLFKEAAGPLVYESYPIRPYLATIASLAKRSCRWESLIMMPLNVNGNRLR